MGKKNKSPYCGNSTGKPGEEAADLFAIIPDDDTQTMLLCPMRDGQTSIKLTRKTAQILIAMLDHQIQEWS